jgi:hypothetical protein
LAAIIREGGNHHKKRANEIALRHAETRLKYSTKYFKKKKKSQFVTSNFYLNLRCKREKMKKKSRTNKTKIKFGIVDPTRNSNFSSSSLSRRNLSN